MEQRADMLIEKKANWHEEYLCVMKENISGGKREGRRNEFLKRISDEEGRRGRKLNKRQNVS